MKVEINLSIRDNCKNSSTLALSGMAEAYKQIEKKGRTDAAKLILLITDGKASDQTNADNEVQTFY